MRGGMSGNGPQQFVEDAALDLFETVLGRLDQAEAAPGLGHQAAMIMGPGLFPPIRGKPLPFPARKTKPVSSIA
jgi:hypothetical protein